MLASDFILVTLTWFKTGRYYLQSRAGDINSSICIYLLRDGKDEAPFQFLFSHHVRDRLLFVGFSEYSSYPMTRTIIIHIPQRHVGDTDIRNSLIPGMQYFGAFSNKTKFYLTQIGTVRALNTGSQLTMD